MLYKMINIVLWDLVVGFPPDFAAGSGCSAALAAEDLADCGVAWTAGGVRVWTGDAARGLPHLLQNFTPGRATVPQLAHLIPSTTPATVAADAACSGGGWTDRSCCGGRVEWFASCRGLLC